MSETQTMFARAEKILGAEAMMRLHHARVALFGLGGVGSFAAEALARGGIGHLTLVAGDTVSFTNRNRQLIARHSTIGRYKTEVMAERIRDISPDTEILTHAVVYGRDNRTLLDFAQYDYIVDAVDMVTAKLLLIEQAKQAGVPIISCMGTGNKLDPSRFEVADISQTSVCPLAKVMRRELKQRGIRDVKVVYSTEQPRKPNVHKADERTPGSLSYVPPVAGMLLAGAVIRHIAQVE